MTGLKTAGTVWTRRTVVSHRVISFSHHLISSPITSFNQFLLIFQRINSATHQCLFRNLSLIVYLLTTYHHFIILSLIFFIIIQHNINAFLIDQLCDICLFIQLPTPVLLLTGNVRITTVYHVTTSVTSRTTVETTATKSIVVSYNSLKTRDNSHCLILCLFESLSIWVSLFVSLSLSLSHSPPLSLSPGIGISFILS